MALYAYDDCDLPVFAGEAEERISYKCCGCRRTVRVRKGPRRIPHFYHLRTTSSCRLYGKSQDHLLAQLAIQKILPRGEAIVEKRFPEINRIGDLVWEKKKIIFEIQCSNIALVETEQRVSDYLKIGYHVVWILDDRIFNRRTSRAAERWMRQMPCYFATLRGMQWPIFYDQFEIFWDTKRVKRGQRLNIRIDTPCPMPQIAWDKKTTPQQVIRKTGCLYFQGDLLHRALSSHDAMKAYKALERMYTQPVNGFKQRIYNFLEEALGTLMHHLQELNDF